MLAINPTKAAKSVLTRFLNPKNDVAFKKIFGNEKNKAILIHFLNDMLKFKEGKPITDVTFLNTVQDPEIAIKKTSIVDVICTDELNNRYIVEMQVTKEKGFIERAQYYAAKAYCSQLGVGGKYANLKEVIFLAIADFTMFPKKASYKSDHVIMDLANHECDLHGFSFTFLELEKFKTPITKLHTMIEKWAYFFKYAEETSQEDMQKIIKNDTIMQQAYEQLNKFYWEDKELLAYEEAVKRQMDYEAAMDQKYDEGKAEGIIDGEKKKAIAVAKKMLKTAMDVKLIVEFTQLSVDDIKNLK